MKVMMFMNHLVRDLKTKSLTDLSADTIQEMVSAANAVLQQLLPFGSESSRLTEGVLAVNGPATIALGVTSGSTAVTGYTFGPDNQHCTIRIGDDLVDNRVVDATTLLYPYRGLSGTVNATLFQDAIGMQENFLEIVGNLHNVDVDGEVYLDSSRGRVQGGLLNPKRAVARPSFFWVEENARNNNPNFSNVLRFDTLPEVAYRFNARLRMATMRIQFTDVLTSAADVPLLDSHIDAYMLPMVRGIMTSSPMWEDRTKIEKVRTDAATAYQGYMLLANDTSHTPASRIGTPAGW